MPKEIHVCNQSERIAKIDKDVNVALAEIISDIKHVKEVVESIHDQTKKTNGRVTKIENETIPNLIRDEVQPLKTWRNILSGAWLIISIILAASWGIVSEYIRNIIK